MRLFNRRGPDVAAASGPAPMAPGLSAADLEARPSELRSTETLRTVAVDVTLSLSAADEALTKLRSWAAISGVGVIGSGVLHVDGEAAAVHLPIAEGATPHAETGLRESTLAEGPARAYAGLRLVALPLLGRYELHAGPKGFADGILFVRGAQADRQRPIQGARPAA